MWDAKGYTFIHSGHPLLGGEEPAERNEGVGIALDETGYCSMEGSRGGLGRC